ncbi:hypothetical protein I4U23_029417 [Adineta vaga]|nr:hypothetical protein I4U23_029417 [Adineta vaga]
MLLIKRYQFIYFLLFVTLIFHMANSNAKTCWPELIGKTAEEAVQVIKDESGLSKVHVCGPGSRTTRDVDDERVRVYVDEENKVTTKPTVG